MRRHYSGYPQAHSKLDRHFKQIWESSAALNFNAARIIILPSGRREAEARMDVYFLVQLGKLNGMDVRIWLSDFTAAA